MNYKIMKFIISIGFITLLIFIPLITNYYYQFIINIMLVNFLAALGLAILVGYAGQFAFASAAFLGIGAYTVGLSMVHIGVSYWTAFSLSILVSSMFAILLALIGLRLSKYYLAIATMAFMFSMRFFYIHAVKITYGASGFNIPYPKLFGFSFDSDKSVYYIVVIIVLILSIFSRNILTSKIGRAFIAVREKEEVASAVSINVKQYKILAFLICGVLCGCAGGLYTIVVGRITPDEFGMLPMVLHFVIVVLGGLGSFIGLILSCVIVTLLPEFLRAFKTFQEILYGLILLGIILFAPEGLYGLMIKYSPLKWREKLYGNIRRK